ncbi:MAG: HAD-IIIC family phosphatase [Alphaproteobacteria bacterium]|nr:HAD-IIIC family phosphatase [Alphaproteobacteria bacterium]
MDEVAQLHNIGALIAAGQAKEAAAELERLVELPEAAVHAEHIAQFSQALDRPDLLDNVLSRPSGDAALTPSRRKEVRFELAGGYLARGDRGRAFRHLHELHSLCAGSPDDLQRLSDRLMQINEHKFAMGVRSEIAQARPGDLYAQLGVLEARAFIDGEGACNELFGISQAPDLPAAFWERASQVYGWVPEAHDLALDAAERAAKLEPTEARHRYRIAYVYLFMGKPKRAIAELKQLFQWQSLSPESMRTFGELALRAEDGALARKYAERQYADAKDDPAAILHLATALIACREVKRAAPLLYELCGKIRDGAPVGFELWPKLIECFSKIGDPEGEHAVVAEALRRYPNNETLLRLKRAADLMSGAGSRQLPPSKGRTRSARFGLLQQMASALRIGRREVSRRKRENSPDAGPNLLAAHRRLAADDLTTTRVDFGTHAVTLGAQKSDDAGLLAAASVETADRVSPQDDAQQLGMSNSDPSELEPGNSAEAEHADAQDGLTMKGQSDVKQLANLDRVLVENDVEELFLAILKRPVNSEEYKKELVARRYTIRQLLYELRASEELRLGVRAEIEAWDKQRALRSVFFRVPQDLVVEKTAVRRILIVGSCLSVEWENWIRSTDTPCQSDLYLVTSELPEKPAQPIDAYDFQVVQMPLRVGLPDGAFARLSQTDVAGHEKLFEHAVNVMRHMLQIAMRWNRQHGILTFVFPYLVPQQNLVGRLMPRYDLRNPVYFVEKLNEALARELEAYSNTYFFDFNEVAATHGRRFVQEDMIGAFNHGSFLGDFDFGHDANRLEPASKAKDVYEERVLLITHAAWEELVAMYRAIRQTDMVKMVVIDLDDTLWRGVVAELNPDEMPTVEGWPKGFWEALAFLKRRGVLLGIISKNEESRVLEVWDQILGRDLALDDFAIRRINWRPKAENMAEILSVVNLLPRNVVYIDDNPAQRAEMKAQFPDIRVLGGTPFTWRHILLWSAETQTAAITAESAARTEMVRAQVAREEQRQSLSQEQFLVSLNVRMNLFEVSGVTHARFPRVLELINKTNQFNTTGRRWTREECIAAFAGGTKFYAFEVADLYTEYGLVGVLVVDKTGIQQFVMSCRIMGLEAEIAAVSMIGDLLRARGATTIFAAMVETERNLPCRDVYARCGFEAVEGGWKCAAAKRVRVPDHINVHTGIANVHAA